MALSTEWCRRWQCHQRPPFVPLNAWSRYRLSLVPKRVVFSYWCGQMQQRRVLLGRSINSGGSTRNRLIRNRLNGLNPFSELGLSSEVSDGAQADDYRPRFDLDLAVLLAGFAFESYNTPAKNAGVLETDGGDLETTYLSREFIKSLYDGQLLVNLKKGVHFPGLDLWGTSDPYVVLRIGDCCVQSRTIWANKDPVWNENLTLNIKTSAEQTLKVAAWDANVVTSQRRMGNTSVSLDSLCDGKLHSLELDLEGMGGGATLFLEVQFKSFAQIEAEKNQFSIGRLFSGELLANAFKSIFGENGISVGEFMGDFMSISNSASDLTRPANATISDTSENEKRSAKGQNQLSQISAEELSPKDSVVQKGTSDKPPKDTAKEGDDGEVEIWKNLAESFSGTLKPFGIDMSGVLKDEEAWEVGDDVKSVGLESQRRAEFLYADSGLAVVEDAMEDSNTTETNGDVSEKDPEPSLVGKDVLEGLMKQTEWIVGAWAIFNKSHGENQSGDAQEVPTESESQATATATASTPTSTEFVNADDSRKKQEEDDGDLEADGKKTTMFSTAESAMEAWALLATTMGGTCFVKSDFEKICFLENKETDTQVAIWRDLRRQRLVIAFRGTEQTKWKDVMTDISLLAAGFNPERVLDGQNSKDEPLVHSGFLKAYDSVKSRLLSLVRASIDSSEPFGASHWQVYVTGHSLGGALATLFALELSTSKLAKKQRLNVTMYNYGSPRVGNRLFADNYNKMVKDSWRVVNHRDIVPTVPRLMGYCHVAQPIYLTPQESPMSELLDDGYNGDVLGEATPDIIINKFMKGEQTLLQKLLDTEIAMLRAMRDGSAVMQHMEDFYYITLLQRVESRIRR